MDADQVEKAGAVQVHPALFSDKDRNRDSRIGAHGKSVDERDSRVVSGHGQVFGGTDMTKLILDATCGMRGIWFQKNEPHTLFCDARTAHYESDYGTRQAHRTIDVKPDMEIDFTDMPFEDGTFNLVVFDPPHLIGEDKSWLKRMYGCYETKEEALRSVAQGIRECVRVLRTGGGVGVQVERVGHQHTRDHRRLRL